MSYKFLNEYIILLTGKNNINNVETRGEIVKYKD